MFYPAKHEHEHTNDDVGDNITIKEIDKDGGITLTAGNSTTNDRHLQKNNDFSIGKPALNLENEICFKFVPAKSSIGMHNMDMETKSKISHFDGNDCTRTLDLENNKLCPSDENNENNEDDEVAPSSSCGGNSAVDGDNDANNVCGC